jgi:hypothetical protein
MICKVLDKSDLDFDVENGESIQSILNTRLDCRLETVDAWLTHP